MLCPFFLSCDRYVIWKVEGVPIDFLQKLSWKKKEKGSGKSQMMMTMMTITEERTCFVFTQLYQRTLKSEHPT